MTFSWLQFVRLLTHLTTAVIFLPILTACSFFNSEMTPLSEANLSDLESVSNETLPPLLLHRYSSQEQESLQRIGVADSTPQIIYVAESSDLSSVLSGETVFL
ncbi:MAG: hypothetical protein KDD89_09845, partial [Anaerolineales bacterium]|nr:hypothetical protein [Anaerolineales bacterium]